MDPLLSVIVPIYNVENYLKKCIDSILSQTFQDYELLLIDDGSTDGSSDIAKKYAKKYEKIKYIRQDNQGLGGARNTGIKNSRGEYLSFIDSDDYIDKDMYQEMVSKMIEYHLDIVICGYDRVYEDGRIIESHFDQIPKSTIINEENKNLLFLIDPAAWNKIYKKDIFIKNNIWYPSNVWFEDLRTTVKVMCKCSKAIYIEKTYYKYVTRNSSIMNTPNLLRQKEIIEAIDDLIHFFKSQDIFNLYYNELEFLCIQHVYVFGINRVVRIDGYSDLISKFKLYVNINFPEFNKNQYLTRLSNKEKIFYYLFRYNLSNLIVLGSRIKKGLEKWEKF